ncbi:hypothetical protein [Pseudorhodobacter sp.]
MACLTPDGFHDVPGWRVLRHSAEGMVIGSLGDGRVDNTGNLPAMD